MRYSKYRRDDKAGQKQTNPIWRGIGCLLLLITPVVSFAIANLLFTNGVIQQYITIPPMLRRPVSLPGVAEPIPFFFGTLALALAIAVALFAVVFVVYSAMYRVVGPTPYGPTDVPPVRSNRRVRKSR